MFCFFFPPNFVALTKLSAFVLRSLLCKCLSEPCIQPGSAPLFLQLREPVHPQPSRAALLPAAPQMQPNGTRPASAAQQQLSTPSPPSLLRAMLCFFFFFFQIIVPMAKMIHLFSAFWGRDQVEARAAVFPQLSPSPPSPCTFPSRPFPAASARG